MVANSHCSMKRTRNMYEGEYFDYKKEFQGTGYGEVAWLACAFCII